MREIKFEFGFTNHAPVVFTITELMCGNFMNFISKDVGSVKYKRQFTGIQDKNGKEIYEGDVVAWSAFNQGGIINPILKNSEVVYNSEEAKFTLKGNEIWGLIYSNIEVIGNIHQNPELLNK